MNGNGINAPQGPIQPTPLRSTSSDDKAQVEAKTYVLDGKKSDISKPAQTSLKERSSSVSSISSVDSGLGGMALSTIGSLVGALEKAEPSTKKTEVLFCLDKFSKCESQQKELEQMLLDPSTSLSEKQNDFFNKTGFLVHLQSADTPTKPEVVSDHIQYILSEMNQMISDDGLLNNPSKIISFFDGSNPCFEACITHFQDTLYGIGSPKPTTDIDRKKTSANILTELLYVFYEKPGSLTEDEAVDPDKFEQWAKEVNGFVGAKVANDELITIQTIKDFIEKDEDGLFPATEE